MPSGTGTELLVSRSQWLGTAKILSHQRKSTTGNNRKADEINRSQEIFHEKANTPSIVT